MRRERCVFQGNEKWRDHKLVLRTLDHERICLMYLQACICTFKPCTLPHTTLTSPQESDTYHYLRSSSTFTDPTNMSHATISYRSLRIPYTALCLLRLLAYTLFLLSSYAYALSYFSPYALTSPLTPSPLAPSPFLLLTSPTNPEPSHPTYNDKQNKTGTERKSQTLRQDSDTVLDTALSFGFLISVTTWLRKVLLFPSYLYSYSVRHVGSALRGKSAVNM